MNHPKLGTPVDVFLTEHPMTKQLEELNSNHLPGMLWKEEGMQTKDVTPSHTHIIYISYMWIDTINKAWSIHRFLASPDSNLRHS